MGAVVEQMALKGKNYIDLPYVVKGMDLSFSGILTAAVNKAKEANVNIHDLCMSLQETVFAMVTEVSERALAHTGKDEILVTGGVAANNRLKEMLSGMAENHNAKFAGLPAATAIDNGAMIAWLGLLMHQNGHKQSLEDTLVRQHFRPEEVEIIWRN